MINDLVPIVKKFDTQDDIVIYPIFDVHIGSAEFQEEKFINYLKQIKDDPNAYVVIGGDIIDNGTRNSIANPFEQTMRPREQKLYAAELLAPIKDKILCGVPGNHEGRSSKESDDSPLYDIFCKLNIEEVFRENAAFLLLKFGDQSMSSLKRPVYSIVVMHGSGGSGTIGTGINKQERYAQTFDGVDMVITGHTHRPVVAPSGKTVVNKGQCTVTHRVFYNVVATSWLQYGGYAMNKQYAPVAAVQQKIQLGGSRFDIQVTM